MELTVQDIKNLLIFLDRVEIKGNEAQALTEAQVKLKFMGQKLTTEAEAPPPEKPPEGDK